MKRFLKYLICLVYKLKYLTRCKIYATSNIILGRCSFEGKNALGYRTYISNTSLGYGSYIGSDGEFSHCIIGRFCSIGSYVRVVSAMHPVDKNISTHPAFYSKDYYFSYNKTDFVEHLKTCNGYECEIGNDVWIGDQVLIKGGISIGDGAIIGMGSVVTHDVAPYTVIAGVPAKQIRKRFNEDMISQLLRFQWWNKSITWIIEHSNEFLRPIEFLEKYK